MPRQATKGQATKTTDHKAIKKWAEERGGKPAVQRTPAGTKAPSGCFATFDQKKLAFLCQEESADGEDSRFFKFRNA